MNQFNSSFESQQYYGQQSFSIALPSRKSQQHASLLSLPPVQNIHPKPFRPWLDLTHPSSLKLSNTSIGPLCALGQVAIFPAPIVSLKTDL